MGRGWCVIWGFIVAFIVTRVAVAAAGDKAAVVLPCVLLGLMAGAGTTKLLWPKGDRV